MKFETKVGSKSSDIRKEILIIKVLSWIFIIVGILTLLSTVFLNYLRREELIGAYLLPVDFFSKPMLEIYLSIVCSILFIVSSVLILKDRQIGYFLLLITILLNFLIYLAESGNFYGDMSIELFVGLLIRIVFYAVPAIILFKILRNNREKEKKT